MPGSRSCCWCGSSVSSCPCGSMPHRGLKAGPSPGKAGGPLENQKNPTWGHCFHPLTGLCIQTSSGWVLLREEPPCCSPKRTHIPNLHSKVPGNLLGWLPFEEGPGTASCRTLPSSHAPFPRARHKPGRYPGSRHAFHPNNPQVLAILPPNLSYSN